MPSHDDIWSEALQEAYASAPTDEVILHTLELRHDSFAPGVSIRVVSDNGEHHPELGDEVFGLYLTVEAEAVLDPGESVFFQACMIDMSIPDQPENSMPSIEISLDNVTKTMMGYLDEAITFRSPMEITYREYLFSDVTTPQFILNGLSIKTAKANLMRFTATAQFSDLQNKSFPKKVYRPSEFPGLRT